MAQARVCPECKTIGLNSCHHKVPGYTEVCDGYARDGCHHDYCNKASPQTTEVDVVPYRSKARIDGDCDACRKPLLTEVHRIEVVRYAVFNAVVQKCTGVRDTRLASLCGTCANQVFADMGLEGYEHIRRGR